MGAARCELKIGVARCDYRWAAAAGSRLCRQGKLLCFVKCQGPRRLRFHRLDGVVPDLQPQSSLLWLPVCLVADPVDVPGLLEVLLMAGQILCHVLTILTHDQSFEPAVSALWLHNPVSSLLLLWLK